MVSVGIDLRGRRSDLVGVDDLGGVSWKHRITSSPVDFLRVFGELEPGSFEVAVPHETPNVHLHRVLSAGP